MIDQIKSWIEQNNLSVNWLSETIFELDNKNYLCLSHKEGKIFNQDFTFIINDKEIAAFQKEENQITNFCFAFGGKVYYSKADSDKVQLKLLRHIGKIKDQLGFPHLGIHGGYELCSGSGSYQNWAKKAKWLGVDVLGLAEKHTLAGAIKFQNACKKEGIKSIIGETVVIKGFEEEYKIKLYVSNYEGWRNLLRIHKNLNIENAGQFVEESVLLKNTEGLYLVFCSDVKITVDRASSFLNLYHFVGVFFQYDPVQYKSSQRDLHCLECLKTYLKEFKDTIPLALICDSYYLDKEESRVKKILSFIGKGEFYYQSDDQYFKSLEDIIEQSVTLFETKGEEFALDVLESALKGTETIISGCNFSIPLGEIHLPKYEMTVEEKKRFKTNEDLFWGLITNGLNEKVGDKPNIEEYLERLEEETKVILNAGLESYFLILHDLTRWCKENGILTGIGRGSAAGSLISYTLSITEADPIEYGLLFSRFVNSGRLPKVVIDKNGEKKLVGGAMSDIDFDVSARRRDEVKRYIEERWNKNSVCTIGAYTTLKLKAAFRDLLRFHGQSPQDVNFFTGFISESGNDLESLFHEAGNADKLKQYIVEQSEAINDIELVLGQPKSASMHAAGLVITPKQYDGADMEIFDWMPCKLMDGNVVSEWDGSELDSAGFLKEDILGLSQLDKIADIIDLIEKRNNVKIDWLKIDRKDKNVFNLFKKGLNQDVFQFGTDGLSSYCREVKPESIFELADINALYRPGPMDSGAHNDYVKIKHGKKEPVYDWGTEDILKSTYSLMTYQEQIMKICQRVANFTLEDADGIRKAIGKKLMDKMLSYKQQFINGAIANKCSLVDANVLWNKIEAFANYSFCLAHAVCYAITGYNCNYFKYYYPLEFWTISLQEADDDEVPKRISELNKFEGIKLHAPEINKSRESFYTDWDKNSIYWSLSRISHVGEKALTVIMEERNKNGQYFSLEEFIKRVKGKEVNSRVVKHLILSGCFDELHTIDFLPKRLKLIEEFCGIYKIDLPLEFKSKEIYEELFWYKWQRSLSGYGYFDYAKLLSEKGYHYNSYIMPDQMQLSDNEGWTGNVCGLLNEVTKRKTKKGEMAKLTLDSNNELIDVVLWNDQWIKVQDQIEKSIGSVIVASGQVKYDGYNKKNVLYSIDKTEIEIF